MKENEESQRKQIEDKHTDYNIVTFVNQKIKFKLNLWKE